MLQKTAKVSNGKKKPAVVVRTAKKASSDSDSSEDEVIHRIYTCNLLFLYLIYVFLLYCVRWNLNIEIED